MNQQAGTKRTRIHFLHWVVVLWISFHSAAIASSLDDLFTRGSALWTLTPTAFMQAYQGDGFKKMSNEDAWAITTGLYAIEPRWTKR